MKYNFPNHLKGLNNYEVLTSQKLYGYNSIKANHKNSWYILLFDILKEPMLLLLIAVTIIYVIVGNYSEALFMLGAIIAVSGISFYQDNRSKKALEALEKLNEPLSTVIRNSKELLLKKDISPQVIYKDHLPKEDFYNFLSNIYVALLAKMGGIP
ncbi:MAG: cation-transporting P-type ATPase [Saprospiraceae bacterium]|nr:MAG: cation-transporting P-type ATPase [Saprospiraceae bacterium]